MKRTICALLCVLLCAALLPAPRAAAALSEDFELCEPEQSYPAAGFTAPDLPYGGEISRTVRRSGGNSYLQMVTRNTADSTDVPRNRLRTRESYGGTFTVEWDYRAVSPRRGVNFEVYLRPAGDERIRVTSAGRVVIYVASDAAVSGTMAITALDCVLDTGVWYAFKAEVSDEALTLSVYDKRYGDELVETKTIAQTAGGKATFLDPAPVWIDMWGALDLTDCDPIVTAIDNFYAVPGTYEGLRGAGPLPDPLFCDAGTQLWGREVPAAVGTAQSVWRSNSTVVSMGRFTPYGTGGEKNVLRYYNNRTAAGNGLPEDETMEITIAGLSLDTGTWGGMELTFRYVTYNHYVDVRLAGDFRVYASTDGGETWSGGYATMAQCRPVAFGLSDSGAEGRCYDVISTDIAGLVEPGQIINAVKIKPYGDCPAKQYFTCIAGTFITGYEFETPDRAPKDGALSVPEATLRQIVTDHGRTVATTPWTTDTEIVTYNASGQSSYTEEQTQRYLPGRLYKGPAYSRGIDSTLEMWRSALDGTRYVGGTADDTVFGWDCIQVVASAWSRILPVGSATYHLYCRYGDQGRLLGGLENRPFTNSSAELLARYTDRQIAEAYALLKPGDHLLKDGHSRLVTVAPAVSRRGDGSIDLAASTLGITEEAGAILYYWQDAEGRQVTTAEKDPAAYLAGHPGYTYLYGTSCRVDRTFTFAELRSGGYSPYTLQEFDREAVTRRRVSAATEPSGDVTADGFELIALSNYHINRLTVTLTDAAGATLAQTVKFGETHDFELDTWDDGMNAQLAALPAGRYTLAVDVRSGPVTEPGGLPPETRIFERGFTVGERGDLNGDGKVNGKDVSLMQRFIAGGYGVTLDGNAADLNGDGKVNGKDVSLLQRFIAGGYGVTL